MTGRGRLFAMLGFVVSGALCGGIWLSAGTRAAAAIAAPPTALQPGAAGAHGALIGRYCATCHNDRLKTGGLVLDPALLGQVGENVENVELWEKVVVKLRNGAMPPPGASRPDQPSIDALADWLEAALDTAGRERLDPGRTAAFHRLNRTEYQNAIRDLLALDVECRVAAAGRRHRRTGLRQRRRCAFRLAGSSRAVPVGGAQSRAARRRALAARAGRGELQGTPPAGSRRSDERGPAVRVARRDLDQSLLPDRRRVRDPDSPASKLRELPSRARHSPGTRRPPRRRPAEAIRDRRKGSRTAGAGELRRQYLRGCGVGEIRALRRFEPDAAVSGQGRPSRRSALHSCAT